MVSVPGTIGVWGMGGIIKIESAIDSNVHGKRINSKLYTSLEYPPVEWIWIWDWEWEWKWQWIWLNVSEMDAQLWFSSVSQRPALVLAASSLAPTKFAFCAEADKLDDVPPSGILPSLTPCSLSTSIYMGPTEIII